MLFNCSFILKFFYVDFLGDKMLYNVIRVCINDFYSEQ